MSFVQAPLHTNNHPNPCHQNWQDMEQRATGRHCAHCDKTVTDFTHFTDAQLLDYFAHHKEKTCGRFTAWQVGRVLQVPPQPHSRLYRMFIALGLTLVFTQVPEARGRVYAPIAINNTPVSDSTTTSGVKGVVLDERNEPVIGAVVQVFQHGVNKGGTATDISGTYEILLDPGQYSIRISFNGYISIMESITVGVNEAVSKKNTLCINHDIEEVDVIEYREPLITPFGQSEIWLGGASIEQIKDEEK